MELRTAEIRWSPAAAIGLMARRSERARLRWLLPFGTSIADVVDVAEPVASSPCAGETTGPAQEAISGVPAAIAAEAGRLWEEKGSSF